MYKIYDYNYVGFENNVLALNGTDFCKITAEKGYQKFFLLFNSLETDMFYKLYESTIIKKKNCVNKNLINCLEKLQKELLNFDINLSDNLLIDKLSCIKAKEKDKQLLLISPTETVVAGMSLDTCFINQFNSCIKDYLIPIIESLKS